MPRSDISPDLVARADLVVQALAFTAAQVESDRFTRHSELRLRALLKDLADWLDVDDKPALFVPADVWWEGSWELGAMLTADGFAVLAWGTGTLRVKTHSRVMWFEDIRDVVLDKEPGDIEEWDKVTLTIHHEEPATVRVTQMGSGWNLPFVLQAVLIGAMTFNHDDTPSQG